MTIACGIRDDPPETQARSEDVTSTVVEHFLDEDKIQKLKAVYSDILLDIPTLEDGK